MHKFHMLCINMLDIWDYYFDGAWVLPFKLIPTYTDTSLLFFN